MTLPTIAIDALPTLATIPAAHGSLLSPVQLSGQTLFDIVIAVIIISHN